MSICRTTLTHAHITHSCWRTLNRLTICTACTTVGDSLTLHSCPRVSWSVQPWMSICLCMAVDLSFGLSHSGCRSVSTWLSIDASWSVSPWVSIFRVPVHGCRRVSWSVSPWMSVCAWLSSCLLVSLTVGVCAWLSSCLFGLSNRGCRSVSVFAWLSSCLLICLAVGVGLSVYGCRRVS